MRVRDPPLDRAAISARLAHERGRAATAVGRASTTAHDTQVLHFHVAADRRRAIEIIQTAHQTIAESRRLRARAKYLRRSAGRAGKGRRRAAGPMDDLAPC